LIPETKALIQKLGESGSSSYYRDIGQHELFGLLKTNYGQNKLFKIISFLL